MDSHSQAYFLSAAVWAINRLYNRLNNWLDNRLDNWLDNRLYNRLDKWFNNWFNNWLDNCLQECLHVTACCTTGSVQTRTSAVSTAPAAVSVNICCTQDGH